MTLVIGENKEVIAGHSITWSVEDYKDIQITDLDDCSIEHVTGLLIEGYWSGELHLNYYPNDNLQADPITLSGWWTLAT